MKRNIFLICLLFSFIFVYPQGEIKYYFGFSIFPDINASLISFGILKVTPDGKGTIIRRSRQDFILEMMGKQSTVANLDTANLFKINGISISTLDSLWKLKYSEYPYEGKNRSQKGWSNREFIPSKGQFKILNQFGIYKINDFCYGENAVSLLLSMQDPIWVRRYSSQ